jgi:preprotein translocase subunit SecG
MVSIILIIHVLLSIGLITLVLIQHGKGADAGAAFGSGASATVFGAKGATSFLTKLTTGVAVTFFATSLLLAYLATDREVIESVTDKKIEKSIDKEGKTTDLPPIPATGDKKIDTNSDTDMPALPTDNKDKKEDTTTSAPKTEKKEDK